MPKKRIPTRRKSKQLYTRLSDIEQNINQLKQVDQKLVKEEKQVEQKENKILGEEEKIEKVLFKIGNFEFRRKHLMEFIKGIAGAFLGVGLGKSLLNMESLAERLQWWNIIGILIFIVGISWLLIYKNERQYVQKQGFAIVWKKLIFLYVIALVIEFFALWLFASLPPDPITLVKILVIGSYAAMAGAVSFSLI